MSSDPASAHGFCAKVGDFGLSRREGCRLTGAVPYGTLIYKAPELVDGVFTKVGSWEV